MRNSHVVSIRMIDLKLRTVTCRQIRLDIRSTENPAYTFMHPATSRFIAIMPQQDILYTMLFHNASIFFKILHSKLYFFLYNQNALFTIYTFLWLYILSYNAKERQAPNPSFFHIITYAYIYLFTNCLYFVKFILNFFRRSRCQKTYNNDCCKS